MADMSPNGIHVIDIFNTIADLFPAAVGHVLHMFHTNGDVPYWRTCSTDVSYWGLSSRIFHTSEYVIYTGGHVSRSEELTTIYEVNYFLCTLKKPWVAYLMEMSYLCDIGFGTAIIFITTKIY